MSDLLNKPTIAPDPVPQTRREAMDQRVAEAAKRDMMWGLSDDTMGEYLFRQQMSGQMSSDQVDQALEVHAETMGNLTKGVAAGPFTLAPDMIGLVFDTLTATTGIASEYMYGDKRGQTVFPEFNGDPIRQLVGLDPESGWGMVGEAFGGWENALAKGGTAAVKLFTQAMTDAPDVVLGTIMGARAARNMEGGVQAMDNAVARLANGDNPGTVLAETGWYRGDDGKMKFVTSDQNVRIDEQYLDQRMQSARSHLAAGEETTVHFDLGELLPENSPLFQGYPNMANMEVGIRIRAGADGNWHVYTSEFGRGTKAYWQNPFDPHMDQFGRIEVLHADDIDGLRRSLLHEIQHAVQYTEDFATGANALKFQEVADMYAQTNAQWRMANAVLDRGSDNLRGYDEIHEFLVDYFDREIRDGMSPEELTSLIDSWSPFVQDMVVADPDTIQNGLLAITQRREQAMTIAALELKTPNRSVEQTLDLLKGLDNHEVYDLAMKRYLAAGGEAEARLIEYLRDMSLNDIRTLVASHGATGMEDLTQIATRDALKSEGRMPDEAIENVNPRRDELAQVKEMPTRGDYTQHLPEVQEHFQFNDSQMEFLQKMVDRDPRLAAKIMELLETGEVAEPITDLVR